MRLYRQRYPPKVMRGCLGKHRHPSEGAALAHVRSLIKVGAVQTEALHVYFCVRCRSYHVGNRLNVTR